MTYTKQVREYCLNNQGTVLDVSLMKDSEFSEIPYKTLLKILTRLEEEKLISGIEKGSIVIISTIGCQNNEKVFLMGFNELKRRINPPLIIVFGEMIEGMTGTFVNYKYSDSFNKKYEQLKLDGISNIFTIKEVA